MFDKINEMKSYLDDMAVYSKKHGGATAYVDVDYLHALLVDIENDAKDWLREKDVSDSANSAEGSYTQLAVEKIAEDLERMASEAFWDASKYASSCSKSYISGEASGIHHAALYLMNAVKRKYE